MEQINVLIVDDKPDNITALEALLQRNDINLITTSSPNEALRLCWENDIAIALVDVQMPEMDGFELVEILKSNPRTKEILVIFVTAISKETKYAVKGLNAGAVDYLYKPLDPYITSAKVDSFIQLVRYQRDIIHKNTELETYQKELIIAKDQAEQAKRIKENFLANMSHEIRTPINGILGLAHLLENTQLSDDQKSMLHLLSVSSQSLLGVINDILDISKIEAGKFKIVRTETDVCKLAQSVIDLIQFRANEKGLELRLQLDPHTPHLMIMDSLRLNQILMNLISNAVKFTEKGSVVLSIKVLDRKGNNVQLEFSVTDTGIGIAPSKLDKVFEAFEQAEDRTTQMYGGTGLGLSIVKKLVELKGGILAVKSEEGYGSTFSFTNWYQVTAEREPMAEKGPTDLNPMRFINASVLVAEDNTINQFMIIRMLKGWNVHAEAVDDGVKVLEKLREKHYDLILMDTYMPLMNGFETTRKIRAEMPDHIKNIPIISLSAAVLEEEQQAAKDAGVNNVLTKPFDPKVLFQMIHELITQ